MTEIQEKLYAYRDEGNSAFVAKLVPNVAPEKIMGVRTPQMRMLAKELNGTKAGDELLLSLPHEYFEENNLHGLLIDRIKDYDGCIRALNSFLPFVDNWSTCDLMRPKVFKNHRAELIEQIKLWVADEHTYTIRFGLEMLMSHFLDEDFKDEYLELAASVHSEEYYVNMMQAWFFATALAKQYDSTLPYITGRRLGLWTHNKTIQKAVESNRISAEQKIYLKTLKLK